MDAASTVILLLASLACLVTGYRQLRGKGFLLNNAYILASKSERESMNKTPYYKQSAAVLCTIGMIFALLSFATIFEAGLLSRLALLVTVILVIFSILSSVYIAKKHK